MVRIDPTRGSPHMTLRDLLCEKIVSSITSPFVAQKSHLPFSPRVTMSFPFQYVLFLYFYFCHFGLNTLSYLAIIRIAWAHIRIKVTDNQDKVSVVEANSKLVVEGFLYFPRSLVGWCLDLDDCGILTRGLRLSRDNRVRYWLLLLQALSSLLFWNAFFMRRIITYQPRMACRLSSCQRDLPGPCSSCFANFQDSKFQLRWMARFGCVTRGQ